MREPTKLELEQIGKVRKYRQPECPGCGSDMMLFWGSSALRENYFIANYRCINPSCIGHWQTGYHTSLNAAHAVEDAYKGAIMRRQYEYNKRDHQQACENADLRA